MAFLINMFCADLRARTTQVVFALSMSLQIVELEQTEMMLRTEQMVKMELIVKTWKTALMSVQLPE